MKRSIGQVLKIVAIDLALAALAFFVIAALAALSVRACFPAGGAK